LLENKINRSHLYYKMEHVFRLTDFNAYNEIDPLKENEEENKFVDKNTFIIQMFGIDERGKNYSLKVEGYKPFFYVMVNDTWTIGMKEHFIAHLREKMGNYYRDSITDSKIIRRKKLYGFDNKKEHKYIFIEFANMGAFNKAKNFWYSDYQSGHQLLKDGYVFFNTNIKLYESNIPPLLRSFHIKDISPSGWIAIPKKRVIERKHELKMVNCDYDLITDYKNIIPLNDKETRVPYKIMSFDIEASSSHGDFPIPIKTYKKLATNIVEYFEDVGIEQFDKTSIARELTRIILTAFGYDNVPNIDLVYPKKRPDSKEHVLSLCKNWLECRVRSIQKTSEFNEASSLESVFEKMAKEFEKKSNNDDSDNDSDSDNDNPVSCEEVSKYYNASKSNVKEYSDKKATIVDILLDKKYERDGKLAELNLTLNSIFPKLEGDKVTFIGSTFMKYGDKDPYFNHCIALNTCTTPSLENTVIESYTTERDVLLAWQKLVQREKPDIIIGYNIFGFDYEFMFRRAEETDCVEEFLKLSKNIDEICGTRDRDTGKWKIEESSIQIASGQHDLRLIKMNGIVQIDLYNFYRRGENLSSYKLDYVGGYFIGDFIKHIQHDTDTNQSIIQTSNMTGLLPGNYIHIEEIGHSVDYYLDGAKFMVSHVDKLNSTFTIQGLVYPDMSKKIRWCLAKDDVTPKDIFRLSNGSADDRAIVAKYCIQDCNLVHYLFNKSDILTGYIEMAKICSVPISYLVMRGQGIKLLSLISCECRKVKTLIPVIEKGDADEGYEGADVLDPKCDLYTDNPVACNDYASLYPSSMISENLSHDSKVWTKEYDLAGNLIEDWGEKDAEGNYIYDNLPEFEYVTIEYDTYRYFKKHPKASSQKIKCGRKICRFVQFPNGESAIIPSVLKKLLKARKDTRTTQKKVDKEDFMWGVLEQRQLGCKVSANSIYGGCGAKTSSFYEKDIAACTTAMGRKLLTYGKRIVEECYKNKICETKNHGLVLTNAEYIYGDSVANYTPIYIKCDNVIEIITIDELANKYGNNHWIKCSEPGKQDKEFCELTNIETWTENGWTKLYRVIRHELASHKKMMRILTHTGLVDVTDDHSLVKSDGTEIKPNEVTIGCELLHNKLRELSLNHLNPGKELYSMHFNNMLEASQYVNYLNHIKYSDYYIATDHDLSIRVHVGLKRYGSQTCVIKKTEIEYSGYVYDLTTENHHFAAGVGNVIVHNTDSVFYTFNLKDLNGNPIRGKDALEITIELAQEVGEIAAKFLKSPHDFEYEKTFMPFCLLSKKRYVGMLYETDPTKCKRKEMGIVLKRRDNAPIVKDIYGGIIDILMKTQNLQDAIQFLRSCLQNIVDEKYPIEKLVITKSLRSGYKNPKSIAHKVLADRITARDPGNKPCPGDRIPFAYICVPGKKVLQGNKIETPTYIQENKLKLDYSFYITNQIMKPVQQLFALVIEKIWTIQNKHVKILKFQKEVNKLRNELITKCDSEEEFKEQFSDKVEKMKCKEIKMLLFDEYLRETNNEKEGVQSVTKFFAKK